MGSLSKGKILIETDRAKVLCYFDCVNFNDIDDKCKIYYTYIQTPERARHCKSFKSIASLSKKVIGEKTDAHP